MQHSDDVSVAQVRQQVDGLERGYHDLRAEFRQELHSVEQKMERGFSAITAKLDEKTTPQWQAYGIMATVLIAIGGALFYPVREQAARQDTTIERLRESNEHTARDLTYLQGQLHPFPK